MIGNHLSLPDKLELLNSVRSRSRLSLESITSSQMTHIGGSPPGSPRIDRNSFQLLAGILIEQESLSSLVSIDVGKLSQSKYGLVKEAIDGVHSAKRRTAKPTSTPIVVTIAVVVVEREEPSAMVTKAITTGNGNAILMESVLRTITTNPFNDSLTSKSRANDNASQDSLPQCLEEKASLKLKDKPRRARMPLDSSPLFGRTAIPVPDPLSSTPAPDRSSHTTSSPPTVKLPELDAEVNIHFFPYPQS